MPPRRRQQQQSAQYDQREVVLLSMYPTGVPPSEFARVVRLIETLTVTMLAHGHTPEKLGAAPMANGEASSPGRRNGSALNNLSQALQDGESHPVNELMRAAGYSSIGSLYPALRRLGAKRVGRGLFRLKVKA